MLELTAPRIAARGGADRVRLVCAAICSLAALASSGAARADEDESKQDSGDTATPMPEPIDVTVRGQRLGAPVSRRDPTAASTVVTGEDLRQPGVTAAGALSRVPGVQVTRSGSGAELATASIRGATSAQTPVYLAGVALNDDVTGTADLSTVPLWMLHRIEVYRGNAPEHADQLGIGGAVFFEPRLPQRSEIGIGQEVGSFGARGTWVAATAASQSSAALVGLRRDASRGDYPFLDDRGTRFTTDDDREVRRENADFTSYDAWAIGRQSMGPSTQITSVVHALDREQGVTGLAVVPARHARARVQRLLGAVSARSSCGDEDACQLELSSAIVRSGSRIADPSRELTLLTTSLHSAGTRFVQHVRVQQRFGQAVKLGVSARRAYEQLGIDRMGGASLRSQRQATRFGLSSTVDGPGELSWIGLLAGELHDTDGSGPAARSQVELSGRLGVRWQPTRAWTVLANAGRYTRVPSLGELYGVSPVVLGNSDLTPERGVSVDAGVRVEPRDGDPRGLSGYGEVFGFARTVDALIAFERSSFGVVRPFNVGSARLIGAEAMAGLLALDVLRSELSVTVLDPRDTSGTSQGANDILPFRSRLIASDIVELFTEPSAHPGGLDRAAVGARVSYRASQYADRAGLVVIEAQTALDLELSSQWLERRLAARVAARNVLDARQFDTVGYPLSGRSLHASVEAWWR